MKQKLQLGFRLVVLSVQVLSWAALAHASINPEPVHAAIVECGNQEGGDADSGCQLKDVFSTTARLVNWLISGAGIVAVGGIVYGGFLMVTSAGNESRAGSGKKAVTNSLIGLAIVLLAVLIVQGLVRILGLQGGDNIVTDPNSFVGGGIE